MRELFIVIILFLSQPFVASATDTLLLVDFQSMVLNNHPLIQQANLNRVISEAYLLKGAGALDPKLYSIYDGKDFKGTSYFRRWNSEVKIPTKYPIDFSLGYESNSGEFLNNDAAVPNNGLLYGTVTLSVLKGFLFDEQRYTIRESELLGAKNEIERELILREVLTQSYIAYIDWAAASYNLSVISEYRSRVVDRHNFVIQLYENGDKPEIDTVESRINLNTASKDVLYAKEKLVEKTQKMNLFLWDNDGNPLELLEDVIPQMLRSIIVTLEEEALVEKVNFMNDPLLRASDIKLELMGLDKRLERENLKPQLDLKLNTIHSLGDNDLKYSYNINDYKIGASLEVPLRNRKTRGQLQLYDTMSEQIELDQKYYLSKLQYQYINYLETKAIKEDVVAVIDEKVSNSTVLYEAENLMFTLGESSMFLLNQRERKLLEAQLERLKAQKELAYILNNILFIKLGQVQTN